VSGTTGAMTCNAPVKLSSPRYQHPAFYRPDALPVAQPTVSKQWMEKTSHSTDLLTPSSPGVFQLCLWPLTSPGYLGEGCHTSHQPSEARNSTLQLLIRYTEPPTLNRKLNPYIRCDGDRKFFLPEIETKTSSFLLLCLFCLTGSFFFHRILQVGPDSPSVFQRNTLWDCWCWIFFNPDALPVTQRTVSKHWRTRNTEYKNTKILMGDCQWVSRV